jgi:hypothetical protein
MPKKVGRPKALSMGSATMPSQRAFDDLLWDVMQTCLRHDLTTSTRSLAAWMRLDFPKYQLVPDRTLRRDIAAVMNWAASRPYRLPLFVNDVKSGFDEATGFFNEAIFDKAVAAAWARKPPKLNRDQFKKTLKRLCELVIQNRWPDTVAQIRIVGPKNNCWPKLLGF